MDVNCGDGAKAGVAAAKRSGWILPIATILAVSLFSHGFLLTNDGRIWDSWFVFRWLKAGSWPAISEFFGSVGIPLYALLYWPFRYMGDIVGAFMWATFLCFVVASLLIYRLARLLAGLTTGEAIAIGALTVAMPLFLAAQDFIMFFFILTHTVFLGALLLAGMSLERTRWKHVSFRCAAVLGFMLSFSNAGLLVFYGGAYILLFFRHQHLRGLKFAAGVKEFLVRYPDYFLLPPAAWVFRLVCTPQYGWYESYNAIGANLHKVGDSLWSFLQHVVPFHVVGSGQWVLNHPLVVVMLIVFFFAWIRWAPEGWDIPRAAVSTVQLAGFGCLLLFLALFPYAVAGKSFIAHPVGEDSHHLLLTSLPVALLVFAILRPVCWLGARATSRAFVPAVACVVVICGCRILPEYAEERADWVFSRSVLRNAAQNADVRESSVVFIPQKFSLTKQHAYEIFGFSDAFGELTRFVTHHPPFNQQHYIPPEILSTLLRTTVLPSEYKSINLAGQQIGLSVGWKLDKPNSLDLSWRYFYLSRFGSDAELDEFLAGLTVIQTQVLRPATPLALGHAPERGLSAAAHVPPKGHFTNSSGLNLVSLPWGWWAGQHEVTQQQFSNVMGYNPSLFQDPVRPVERVSWTEAMEFCHRLTAREEREGRLPLGFVYRLPTLLEHEQLADGASAQDAVMSLAKAQWHTEPVGSKRPNGVGLHDTMGNVWEWCLDWGSEAKRFKVSAGGGWANVIGDLRPRAEGWNKSDPYERAATGRLFGMTRRDYPDQALWDRGFRVVLALEKREPVTKFK